MFLFFIDFPCSLRGRKWRNMITTMKTTLIYYKLRMMKWWSRVRWSAKWRLRTSSSYLFTLSFVLLVSLATLSWSWRTLSTSGPSPWLTCICWMWPLLTSCLWWHCLWLSTASSMGGPWGTCLASFCVASIAWTSTAACCSWLASAEIATLPSYRPAGPSGCVQALCFTATWSVQSSGCRHCSCPFPPSYFMSVTNPAQLNPVFGTLLTVKTGHMCAFLNLSQTKRHVWWKLWFPALRLRWDSFCRYWSWDSVTPASLSPSLRPRTFRDTRRCVWCSLWSLCLWSAICLII